MDGFNDVPHYPRKKPKLQYRQRCCEGSMVQPRSLILDRVIRKFWTTSSSVFRPEEYNKTKNAKQTLDPHLFSHEALAARPLRQSRTSQSLAHGLPRSIVVPE